MNKVEWISTKDRLPEEGTPVLIIMHNCRLGSPDDMIVAHLDNHWWYDDYTLELISEWDTNYVTHWAELPEPPIS